MRKKIILLLILCAAVGNAATLSTSFVDVVVLDVPLGVPHKVEDDRGFGIMVRNSGSPAISIHLQAMSPAPHELKGEALPIPDLSWIRILPSNRLIPSNQELECQVILEIPNNRKYRNQLYQVMIWIQSEPAGKGTGVQVRGALKSRLRFKTQ